ncbi:hypothetical protein D9757_011759 [Collybiopsis confluens]|uniref:Type IV pilus biogenesis protein PilP n=1 Tax=Collybiopsis confluens TaxID=2823264 RepID=A0A8H5GA84_9AGAR|nr:hypothetical protein D9757_013457 [Collybiopsis confluens]KAF5365156.1 hypothetical protein D9757_011759 [Collybiopsis confluens]
MLFTSRTYLTFLLGCWLPSLCMTTPVLPRNQTTIIDSAKLMTPPPSSSLLATREMEESLERRATLEVKYFSHPGAVPLDPTEHAMVEHMVRQLISETVRQGHQIGMPSSLSEIKFTGTPGLSPPLPVPPVRIRPNNRMILWVFVTNQKYVGLITEDGKDQGILWMSPNGKMNYLGLQTPTEEIDALKAADILRMMPGGKW